VYDPARIVGEAFAMAFHSLSHGEAVLAAKFESRRP
jgi:hypothetical protein